MEYSHTQKGRLSLILYLSAVAMLPMLWLPGVDTFLTVTIGAVVLVLCGCGLCFHTLTVEDEGRQLALRFGPLPLFRKRFAYDQMTGVEPGRTRLLDGWGIHYVPGRGWTYNLWGYDCVKVELGRKTVRIGTDDVDNLVAFLQSKIA